MLEETPKRTRSQDEALLKEIRENHTYYTEEWRDIREDAREDMRVLYEGPWDPKEKKARKDANRPCLSLDEIQQYLNQLVNGVRQKKRAVKVIPTGSGANDETAELRQNRIRQIEYQSHAQSAYSTAFENAAQRSYGWIRVSTEYISEKSFNQQCVIRRIPNPDTILVDPGCKEADCSDMRGLFALDVIRKEKFKAQWPNAEVRDFTEEHVTLAPAWIHEKDIQIAEYWKVKSAFKNLYLVNGPDGQPLEILEDDPKFTELYKAARILRKRKVEVQTVCQYITNGIEILEENEWLGRWIPFVPVFGKEVFMDTGTGSKRKLISLVRLARDPYMLYCYYRTQQAEFACLLPKVPATGYEGQFAGHEDEWAPNITIPFRQVKGITDGTGPNLLPLPQPTQYDPTGIGIMDAAAESARRAIQAAIGINPLPTAAQRRNEKSGVALEKIEQQQDQGSFHFVDNYERALEQVGRILNDLLPKVEDTARDISVRAPDDTYSMVHINEPKQDPKTGETKHYSMTTGEHDVTINTGQSFTSQREEANAFVDTLIANIQSLPIPPDVGTKLLAMALRLKDLGPIGEEMADLLAPDEQGKIPPQAMAAIQKLQQQGQALNAYAQQLEGEIKKLQQEKDAKIVDNQMKHDIVEMQEQTKILIAQMKVNADNALRQAEIAHEQFKILHGSAHDLALQKDSQGATAQQAEADRQAAEAQPAPVEAGAAQ